MRAVVTLALQIFAAIAIYLAAAYGVIATIMETCTMGSADSLVAGLIVSVPLYLVGLGVLIRRPLPRVGWLGLLPALGLVGYHSYWSARFFVGYHFFAVPACDLITGYGPFEFDGREPFLTVCWLGMSIAAIAGLAWAWLRSRRFARSVESSQAEA